ncbi:lysine transporter LysE [Bacillus pseudomycoides]|uniref:Lysine transporter LysE n=1 Tax=Bacillus pseudomycoides TaxID=64104 RepID=A0AA91ZSD4_9BACI|nr:MULTISPECIES: LysE family translocator [Bacillus]PEB50092.1 lysine transporter LysE [Bacillus sp. AFS098217]PED81384.1 lysine transporter LysE [Bacillus pseudomycoides]PEU08710.1 lysine transporter LysE [Bacillus sp. AFS014408]PEU13468.1 lysine transporter LysE [Bacillus sp. AFS019443]PFW62006.1 lysine transporter LysE [Bacillus sp. AFS075034]
MNINHWTFIVTSILLILSPGIDTALVTKNTITFSTKGGLLTALGIASGILVHTIATGLGLSLLLMQSAKLFVIIKVIGAVYLIFLGISSFKNSNQDHVRVGKSTVTSSYDVFSRLYRQGILTNVLNPKVALFFLTFLPQFTNTTQSFFPQALLLGLIYSGLTLGWFICYISIMKLFRTWILKPAVQRIMERITGVVLICLGLKLAMGTK